MNEVVCKPISLSKRETSNLTKKINGKISQVWCILAIELSPSRRLLLGKSSHVLSTSSQLKDRPLRFINFNHSSLSVWNSSLVYIFQRELMNPYFILSSSFGSPLPSLWAITFVIWCICFNMKCCIHFIPPPLANRCIHECTKQVLYHEQLFHLPQHVVKCLINFS